MLTCVHLSSVTHYLIEIVLKFNKYTEAGLLLQDGNGRVLEKYGIITREEENVVLQQFVRFAETRNLSQELLIQDTKSLQVGVEINVYGGPHILKPTCSAEIRDRSYSMPKC